IASLMSAMCRMLPTMISEPPPHSRSVSCTARTSERNGPVVGVASVRDSDDIMLITTGGMVNRTHIREIRVVGRNTQGVRVMNLNEGDRIASLAKVASEAGEEPPEPAPEAD